VRLGGQVANDMIAVHIRPDMRMAVANTPGYLVNGSAQKKPQELTEHNCRESVSWPKGL